MCEMNQTEILRKNLSIFRKQRHLTQEQLANELGLTFQAISKWENGLSCPDISLLPQLAEIFGVTIDDLFREQTEESVQETTAEEPSAAEKKEEEKAEEKKPDRMTLEISGEDKDVRKMLKDLGVRLEPEINSLNQAADELLQNLFDSKHEPVTLPDLSEERPVSDGLRKGFRGRTTGFTGQCSSRGGCWSAPRRKERARSEAATWIWIRASCPASPFPAAM